MLSAKKFCYRYLVAPILLLIPIAIYVYTKGYDGLEGDVFYKTFQKFVNSENMKYINMGVVALTSILNLVGIRIPLYNMGVNVNLTPLNVGFIIFGILYMTCSVKILLAVISLFKRGVLRDTDCDHPIFDLIYALVNMTMFLLCNIAAGAIGESEMPFFWLVMSCLVFVVLILIEKQSVVGFRSKYEKVEQAEHFFEDVKILKNVVNGLLSSFAMIVFVLLAHAIAFSQSSTHDLTALLYVMRVTGMLGGFCCVGVIANSSGKETLKKTILLFISVVSYGLFAYTL